MELPGEIYRHSKRIRVYFKPGFFFIFGHAYTNEDLEYIPIQIDWSILPKQGDKSNTDNIMGRGRNIFFLLLRDTKRKRSGY